MDVIERGHDSLLSKGFAIVNGIYSSVELKAMPQTELLIVKDVG